MPFCDRCGTWFDVDDEESCSDFECPDCEDEEAEEDME